MSKPLTTFKNKETADLALPQFVKKQKIDWFCPMIKAICIRECVSFRKAWLLEMKHSLGKEAQEKIWMIIPASCGNPMLINFPMAKK